MWKLKDIIFNFFGPRDKAEDLFKNIDGEGLSQRFNELVAKDLDDNELLLVALLVENTQNPWTCFAQYIPYHESLFGLPIFSTDIYIRRKIVALIKEINRRKGTIWGYTFLFRILGFQTFTLTEAMPVFGFDRGIFDDTNRRFDQKCAGCSNYSIALTGANQVSQSIINSILAVIKYNQPINARLSDATYNGVSIFAPNGFLQQENLGYILQENGGRIII